MLRSSVDAVIRCLVIVSLVLTSMPLPVLARPAEHAGYQAESTATPLPTETATPTPLGFETAPAATDTPTATPVITPTDPGLSQDEGTALPTDTPTEPQPATATSLPPASETPPSTATLTPTPLVTEEPTATLTPTATATLTPTVTPLALRVGLMMQTDPAFVQPGELVTVTLTLTNPQQVALENLVISATLPPGLNYASPLGEVTPGYNPMLRLLRWQIPVELSSQPVLSLTYVGQIAVDAPAGALNLSAEISSPPAAGSQSQANLMVVASLPSTPTPAPAPTELLPTRKAAGPPAQVSVVVEPARLQPGQAATVLVYVTDAEGRSVADDTAVTLQANGGSLPTDEVKTREGLARLTLTAGETAGQGQIAAQAGGVSGQADFRVTLSKGQVIPSTALKAKPGKTGPLPFDPAGVIQRVRNRLRPAAAGQWTAKNERYTADWNADGLNLTLAEDDAVERAQRDAAGGVQVSFRLLEIQVGGQSVYRQRTSDPAPVVSDNEARYERAPGLVESYLARDNGLQQLFTLTTPPQGEGDLVISGRFDTPLKPELISSAEGIVFHLPGAKRKWSEGDSGALRYSGAVATDARGRTLYADLALQGQQVSLTVPGAWLAEAEYPVVIDPMLGDPALVSDPRDMQGELDVAYNPDNNEYLVVWGGYDTGGASADLEGQRVAADGTLVGGLITIAQAAGDQKLPAVTYNPDNDEYLVLWTDYRADPDGDVYGQRVTANGSLVGNNFAVGATEALQDTPDVAYNPTNDLYLAVWRDRRGPEIYVYGQVISNSGTLSGTNFAIYNGSGDNQQPRAAYNSQTNEFLAVWSRWWADIYGKRLSGRGALLDNPGTTENEADPAQAFIISNAANTQYSPAVAAGGGAYLVTWEDYRSDSRGDIYGQVIGAGGVLSGTALTISAIASTYQTRPDVVYDPVSQVYQAVWRDSRSGSMDVYGQAIAPGGTLSGTNVVIEGGRWTEYPREAANSSVGGYLVAWGDWRNDGLNVYGRRVAGSGAPQGDSFPIGPVTGLKQYPGAVFNAASGEYLLVWEDYRNGNADIYGQRLNEAGQAVGDNFRLSEPTASGDQLLPKVAAAGAAGYLVTWEDRRSDSNGDIYGQRVLTDGTLAGSNLVIAATAQGQTKADLAYSPGSGQYLAVWRDQRQDGYGDIYGQLVTAGGTLTGSNFIVSAYSSRTQTDPAVAYNPASGQFVVVWTQYQGSNNYDIYGQQVSSQGALLDNPGTPADETNPAISFQLTTDSLDQEYARLAADPASGHTLVTWRDERNYSSTNYDIYGQVLTASGVLSGSNLALSTAANYQRLPAVAALSNNQGFLVSWDDNRRSSYYDLYGQRVDLSGALLGNNQLLVADEGWVAGLALAGHAARPEALVVWEMSDEIYAQRYSVLAADFTAAPTLGSAPLVVTFTNTSTPTTEIITSTWNFGDGYTATMTNSQFITHNYPLPGVYTVSLTVSGLAGSNTQARPTYITVNSPFSATSDLRGYWRLDEQTGLRQDQSGYGYPLTSVNGPAWVEAGYIGSAVDLEKDNLQYLVVSNTVQSGLAISGSLTLLGWVKPESSSSNYLTLAAKYQWYDMGQQENVGYRLVLDENNRLSFIASPDGTAQEGYTLAGTTGLGTGVWHHAAAVFDAQARELRVYVNGVLDGSQAVNYDHLHVSTAPFMLGANLDAAGQPAQHFDGLLDEWRVYARALSQAEIQTIMNQPGAAFTAAARQGFAPLAVTFVNSSTNAAVYRWAFGDGATSTVTNPTHSYVQPGVYTVTLQAANGAVTDTLTRTAYVQVTTPEQGLQGYWRLDESAGTRADSSGQGNTLNDYNTVGAMTGQVGLAADFERDAGEYLALTATNRLAITGSLALVGWTKLESVNSSDYSIFASRYEMGVNNRAYRFGINYQGKLFFTILPDGQYVESYQLDGTTSLQVGNWYHVAAVFDADRQMTTIYLNGQSEGSKTVSFNRIYSSTAPFMLGANLSSGSPAQYFDGLLDEWRVYNRALSQAEVQVLMTTTPPAALFSATPPTGTAPLTVTFTNSSTNATGYLWNFGNGLTSTLFAPTYTYTQPGVYTVTLTATGPGGSAVMTKPTYITVTQALKADFWAYPDNGVAPVTIQFFNNSTGATTYQWTFGDGLTSTLSSPTHTYMAAGVYTVSLTVGDGLGGSDPLTKPNYITVTNSLALVKTAPAGVVSGQPITYTLSITNSGSVTATTLVITDAIPANASYITGGVKVGSVVSWTLSSLPPLSSTTRWFVVTTTQAITNSVYRVSASGGVTAVGTRLVTTLVYSPAVAAFSAAPPVSGAAPLTVTFTHSSTGALSAIWNFGDSCTQTFTSTTYLTPFTFTHMYTQSGIYTVSLWASNPASSNGLTRTNYITVTATPILSVSKVGPGVGLVGQPITYTLSITNSGAVTATTLVITDAIPANASYITGGVKVGSVVSWTLSSLPPLSNTTRWFVVTTTRSITNSAYRVSASGGVAAVGTKLVTTQVYTPVVAAFSAIPLSGTAPLTVTFTHSSTGALSAAWNFGDGYTQTFTSTTYLTSFTLTHVYTGAGVYTVSLWASNPASSNGLTRTNYITATRPLTGVIRGSGFFLDSGQRLGNGWSEAVALGDLDGDGDLDAVVANSYGDSQVWLNTGPGVFTATSLGLGSAQAIALGDVDGDGDLDAVVGNNGTDSVWLNNGSGQFSVGSELSDEADTRAVALGDLNGDGRLDMVMANAGAASTIWLNDGAGHFTRQGQALGSGSAAVALGDLNGDGVLDIAEAGAVWLNNGTGVFSYTGSLGDINTTAIALGDLDGNGTLDAFVSSQSDGSAWLNDSAGHFTSHDQHFSDWPVKGVALGDLNGDGHPDVFVAKGLDSSLGYRDDLSQVWMNDGSGVFTWTQQSLPGSWATAAALGDLDGDGDLDALTTQNYNRGGLVWLNQNLMISKTAPAAVAARMPLTYTLTLTNLDHLSATNLIITDAIPAGATYLGGGDARVGNVVSWTVASLAPGASLTRQYVVTATGTLVNEDYRASAAETRPAARGSAGIVTFVTGMEVTATSPVSNDGVIVPAQPISVTFSRAMNAQTVTTNTFTVRGRQTGRYGGNYVLQEKTAQFAPGAVFKPGEQVLVTLSRALESTDGIALRPYAWQFRAPAAGGNGRLADSGQNLANKKMADVALGDLDGDGDLDAFVVSNSTQAWQGYHAVWLNNGGVFTYTAQIFTNNNNAVRLGDLDNDGDLDAFVGDTVWLNNGLGSFTATGQSLDNGGSIGDVALGDLDGDGDLDAFVAVNDGSPLLDEPLDMQDRVWLNDGTGHFSDSGQRLGNTNSYAVTLGDLDGDGDLDAWVGNSTYDGNQLWLNDGTGRFTDSGQRLFNVGSDLTQAVALGDLDGDGDLDAFVANRSWSGHIAPGQQTPNMVWINQGGVFTDSGQRLGNGDSYEVTLGDVNGDGKLDAVVANYFGRNEVWLNRGDGAFEPAEQSWAEAYNTAADLGDLDGDGDLDAFIGTNSGSQVWLNGKPDWRFITTTLTPPIVGEHAMAYDSARQVVVLYGGNATGWPYENKTWELTGTTWLTITTTLTPAARYGMAIAYDGRQMILFGGSDENAQALNQTWVYTRSAWARVYPATAPLSRTHHSMVADPISGTVYLFGGNTTPAGAGSPAAYNDLWQYTNGAWSVITSTGPLSPAARSRAALAYDTQNRRLLLFGGRSLTGTLLADLWTFYPITKTWQLLDSGGGGSPPARLGHSLTYDPATGSVVLIGGSRDNGNTRLGDTWLYKNGWTQANPATPLPPRAYHQAVYTGSGILLFSRGEVWKYE